MEHKEINLNKEQKEAATHIEGPLLVIASRQPKADQAL